MKKTIQKVAKLTFSSNKVSHLVHTNNFGLGLNCVLGRNKFVILFRQYFYILIINIYFILFIKNIFYKYRKFCVHITAICIGAVHVFGTV